MYKQHCCSLRITSLFQLSFDSVGVVSRYICHSFMLVINDILSQCYVLWHLYLHQVRETPYLSRSSVKLLFVFALLNQVLFYRLLILISTTVFFRCTI